MNNRPTSSVYLLNKLCLIGAFCWLFVQHDRLISSAERLQICRLIADRRCRRSADILQTFCIHSVDDLHIVCRSAGTSVADLQQTINRSARFVRAWICRRDFLCTLLSHNDNRIFWYIYWVFKKKTTTTT